MTDFLWEDPPVLSRPHQTKERSTGSMVRAPSRTADAAMSLLDELEIEARTVSQRLELNNKLPAGFTEQHYPLTLREQAEGRRLKAALHAATDADTFVALVKGLPVPADRLNRDLIRYAKRLNGS